MRKLILLFILFHQSFLSAGQNPIARLDSVYNYCLQNSTDTNALYVLNSGITRLSSNHFDTCLYYAKEQVRMAKDAKNAEMEARGYNLLGMCVEFGGNLDSAIALYNIAATVALNNNRQKALIDIYNNLGIVYSFKGYYEFSLEHSFKALQIAEELQDSSRISSQYNNIGLRYSELDNSELAIEYYLKSVEIKIKLNSNDGHLINSYTNLGREYYINKEYEKSIQFYLKALRLSKPRNDYYKIAGCYQGLAFVSFRMGDLSTASLYNDSLYTVASKGGDEYDMMNYELMRSNLLVEKGDYQEAIVLLRKVREWHEVNGYYSSLKDVYLAVSKAFEKAGILDSALYFMEKYAHVKDTIFSDNKDLANKQLREYRNAKMQQELALKEKSIDHQKSLKNTFIVIGILLLLILMGIGNRFYVAIKTRKSLAEKNKLIELERDRSEKLLLNILPYEVAEELKETGESVARNFEEVTVLFSDFKEFTQKAEEMNATELVSELNICFKAFDLILDSYKIEKIKSIGDAYMAASGLSSNPDTNAADVVQAALEMQAFVTKHKEDRMAAGLPYFEMRVGLHTGPVVAGIVGVKKFQYDIWGDTVNTASRMESTGEVGKVNISQATYELLQGDPDFIFESRGLISAKGKGELKMFFVTRKGSSEDYATA